MWPAVPMISSRRGIAGETTLMGEGPGRKNELFRSRDSGLLHDLAPAHGLRLDEILQPFDRPVFKRKHAEPENLGLDFRQRQNVEELGVELGYDIARSLARRNHHVPARQCPEFG